MKKRKGSLLQRMLAVLLTAVLTAGMVSNAVPVSVLAQEGSDAESVSGNDGELAEEETEPAEETRPEGQEPGDGTEQETSEPDAGTGQETQQPGGGAAEPETVSENDAAPQRAMMAAEPAPQADNIASGTDWVLAADGKLTISSDAGMRNWVEKGRGLSYNCNGESKWGHDIVTSVEISSGVTSIVDHAFSGCKNLPGITLPTGVKSIGENAFFDCENLSEIALPEGVESIGDSAFYCCKSLKSITIPQSITSIGDSVFGGCLNLQTVTICSNTPPACGMGIFYYSDNAKVYVPVCDYLAAAGWIQYKSKIVPATHTEDISYSANGVTITQKCGTCNTAYGTAALSSSGTNFTYTGTAITPVSVTYAGSGTNTWIGEKTTVITYANNTNAGTATASLTLGTGENAATVKLSFTIQPKALTDGMVTLPADSFLYNGNAVTPEITVRDGSTPLIKDTDYTVSYTSNSAVGTAAVTVTAKGNYSGVITKQFQIVESDADKSAAAKQVVDNALAGITATNATTKEEILNVINTALSNANITGVTVEIDKFVKREASTSAAGKIEGVIFIGCGQEVRSVNMEKPIAQLIEGGSGGDDSGSGGGGNSGDCGGGSDSGNNNSGSSGGNGGSGDGSNDGNTSNDNGGSDGNTGNDNGGNTGSNNSGNLNGQSGGSGTATPGKAPATVIITPPEDLENAVLTETEKQQKAGGADIRIELDVDVVTAEADAADRTLVEEALRGSAAGYTVGQYLDISLYKVIGDSRTAITETAGKITVRIDVPDSLKNTDSSRARTFAVIRVHDGRTELLTDLDNDADTITIATDRFSTYVLVHQDMAAGTEKLTGGKDDEPKTGDAAPLELYATLTMIAGFTYLLLYFADRRRGMTEETKKELVSRLIGWAKQGGRIRKCLALAAIFVLLVYYHSIGKKTCAEWKEIYGG